MPQKLRNNLIATNKNILSIDPKDVEYIFALAESKGIARDTVSAIYTVLIADVPVKPQWLGFAHEENSDEWLLYSEEELIQAEKSLTRTIYDPISKRLIGLAPTFNHLFDKL